MITAPPSSEPNFYGSIIHSAKSGPRRELTLRIETWPKGKTFFGGGEIVLLRFGGIENFDEVKRFFAELPADSLHYLRQVSKPRARRCLVEMEFDGSERRIKIIAGKISQSAENSVKPALEPDKDLSGL